MGAWSLGCATPSKLEIPSPAESAEPVVVDHPKTSTETRPIDLPTVLRLAEGSGPLVAAAQARLREAEARLDGAQAAWLPTLSVGSIYTRIDGVTQNQFGLIFETNRANLNPNLGLALSVDLAEAIYRPLAEQRQVNAERWRASAVSQNLQLEAIAGYFDLVLACGQRANQIEALAKAESVLELAEKAREQKRERTAGDSVRVRTDVELRRAERAELDGRVAAASARLARVLNLPPTLRLVPTDSAVLPVTMMATETPMDELIARSLATRPDLAANREQLAAAIVRIDRQRVGPWLPRLTVLNQVGRMGGGFNDDLTRFGTRNALTAQLSWELRNSGWGNRSETAERRAQYDQLRNAAADLQARAIAELVEAAETARARRESLEHARLAVLSSDELFGITRDALAAPPPAVVDSFRAIQAVQIGLLARQAALAAAVEHNRAQLRLATLASLPIP